MKRSTCEKKLAIGFEFSDDFRDLAFIVFEFVGFVNDDVMPLNFSQGTQANPHAFETGNHNIEFSFVDEVKILGIIFSKVGVDKKNLMIVKKKIENTLNIWNSIRI